MQFIVVIQPREEFATEGLPDDFAEVELAEQVQAKALYKRDVARQLWAITTERKGAIGLFEADSAEAIEDVVKNFPMVQKDYAEHTIFPIGAFAAFAE